LAHLRRRRQQQQRRRSSSSRLLFRVLQALLGLRVMKVAMVMLRREDSEAELQ